MPRVQPAVKTGQISTKDVELKQERPRALPGKGPATLEPPSIEQVEPSTHIDPEWSANIAFSKELITIRVHESTEENAEKFVEVWNNGDYMKFTRGQEHTCERRFVESLMRAKPIRYSQKAVLDDFGKVGGYQEIPSTALRYSFTIVRDDNPLSQAWLKHIMSER